MGLFLQLASKARCSLRRYLIVRLDTHMLLVVLTEPPATSKHAKRFAVTAARLGW
jgi:hypothetical protein